MFKGLTCTGLSLQASSDIWTRGRRAILLASCKTSDLLSDEP